MSAKVAPSIDAKSGLNGDALISMLTRMTSYFHSMIDPRTHRFYYRCLPEGGPVHGHCPIRDMGAAWDAATLLQFWRARPGQARAALATSHPGLWDSSPKGVSVGGQLPDAIKTTIESYARDEQLVGFEDERDRQCAALSSEYLGEPSNVAHSAFLLLATTGALRLSLLDEGEYQALVNGLANGILSMEHDDGGAFAIHFGSSDIYRGIEFYPGEALLSLLEAYQSSDNLLSKSTREDIVPAAVRAFLFYADYYRCGNVEEHYTSFFGNWQVQCFKRLFEILRETEQAKDSSAERALVTSQDVAAYLFELCCGSFATNVPSGHRYE